MSTPFCEERYRILKSHYHQWPEINGVRLLWHSGYWDGPLNGACVVEGERLWFDLAEEFHESEEYEALDHEVNDDPLDYPWYRRFICFRLTPEQWADIDAKQEKWRRMVGTHCVYSYDENGARSRGRFGYGGGITEETCAQYYAEAKANPTPEGTARPHSREDVVGWFEE